MADATSLMGDSNVNNGNDGDAADTSADAAKEEVPNDEEPLHKSNKEEEETNSNNTCCLGLGECPAAKAFCILAVAKGVVVMSNLFLLSSMVFLASEQVGCVIEVEGEMVVRETCNQRLFGVSIPTAFVSNISVVSGILSALFMPIAGAIVDYTHYRWVFGMGSALCITAIQAAQIFTTSDTWVYMAVLQALFGFFFHCLILASYAYLPEIARKVNKETMARYTSTFSMVQFGSQALFLLLIVTIAGAIGLNVVMLAQVSQTLNSILIAIAFIFAYRLFPHAPPRHELGKGESLLFQGFKQNWKTVLCINREYKNSLRWFLLGITFGDPAIQSYPAIAVIFLGGQLQMDATQIGIFFLIVLVGVVFGGLLLRCVVRRTDPNTTICMAQFVLFVLFAVGPYILVPGKAVRTYVWSFFLGIGFGVYYPVCKLYLSLVVPAGQEAEMAGFFVYCSQILVWLPPLIFSILLEAEMDQRLGIVAIACFFLVSNLFYLMSPPFDEVLKEVGKKKPTEDDMTVSSLA